MIVDDSALVRQILERGFGEDPELEVVGSARDPFEARDRIVSCAPDVMTLDVEMPRMDGVEFLKRLLPQYPLPTVVVSSLTQRGSDMALQALSAGAVDIVAKPNNDLAYQLPQMLDELRQKVKAASRANLRALLRSRRSLPPPQQKGRASAALSQSTDQVIAIGASTGGTEAIHAVLSGLPPDAPGVIVVQHMPRGFTRTFAERLDATTPLSVKEATHGDRLRRGRVLIAPAGRQTRVKRSGGIYEALLGDSERVTGHCPSVDVLLHSMAEQVGANGIGVVLTGMGTDGAKGLLAMAQAGAPTLAQDKATSVVFGMPRAAFECGAAQALEPLDQVAGAVLKHVRSRRRSR